ncbi:MAG: DUF4838 domain-containing protein [Lentisphaeria bacterium]|nr:DUF4838 domain-containing protein [Lentisphaeria bacterium]
MKKRILPGILIACAAFSACAFEITENTAIILPEKPKQSSVLAAQELSKYVEKVSGIKLKQGAKEGKNFIYVGLASDFKELPSGLKEKLDKTVAEDSYIFHAEKDKMFFAGKSKPAELYAVYQFLERELGIRFLKPANAEDDGEYVPEKKGKSLQIADKSFVREPAFRRRLLVPTGWDWTHHPTQGVIWSVKGGYQMGAAYCRRELWPRKNAKQVELYEPRTADVWEENYHNLFQKAIPAKEYYKTHPEYFALINGKRTASGYETVAYCLSNPDVRRLAAEYIVRTIREKKKMGYLFVQGGGLSDMGRGWCECEECLKENETKTFTFRNISNVYNKTVKAIFDLVYKEIPDAQLLLWAYGTYQQPYTAKLRHDERVHFIFLSHGRCYAHAFDEPCLLNQKLMDWLKTDLPRFKRISINGYFLCSGGCNYIPQEHIQARDIRTYHKLGITGWEEEVFFEDSVRWRGARKGPEPNEKLPSLWQWLYLTGKMLWDPSLDENKVLEDIEKHYYGKAYEGAMKEYHALRRKLWKEGANCFGYPRYNERLPLLLNVPANKEKLFALLDKAETLAQGDKKLLYRIGLDRKFLQRYWVKPNEEYSKMQGNAVYAPGTSEEIVIDGKGEEKAWKNAFYVTDFRETFHRDHAPIPRENAISVGLLSDKKNLYFLIDVREPLMDKLYKGKTIWERSSVELFLHPQSVSNEYYHLVFTVFGDRYEARCPGNAKYDIGAEWKCVKTKDGYTMEIKVPAWKLGDFHRGANWKCSFSVNRYVFTDKLIKPSWSLCGGLNHDVTKFLPLRMASSLPVNGMFTKTEKNRRKYPKTLEVLEKVPVDWYANLPQKDARFGIVMEKDEHKEVLCVKNAFACRSLYLVPDGSKFTVSFEAKGKGEISVALFRYRKNTDKFIKTRYFKKVALTENWQLVEVPCEVEKDETVSLAFNCQKAEAFLDNVRVIRE